ncbi:MAG: class II aldolase/adducin family protein [Spirochaetaceae bacterium]|jgi:rhamnose utilization protein RhaD (predicted bifunctional aldolase and dehydrogenase)|nr:class II aldolase/adducin family protein [Spirochaetaceae bacterium]
MSHIETLTALSRHYGENHDYVIAGGGNTSYKDGSTLYVKGSGIALAEVAPESFVKMDRRVLRMIMTKTYPSNPEEREQAVLADMMSARLPGEEQKRPSVETLLHDILPFPWVVHTHPALVNGLTCSRQGETSAKRLFPEAIWIPSTNPGYILSQKVQQAMESHRAEHEAVIFLQNHGVFVGADTAEGIHETYRYIMDKLAANMRRQPDLSGSVSSWGASDSVRAALAGIAGNAVFLRNQAAATLVENRASFAPVASAFTPDHIVYAGSDPLFAEDPADAPTLWNRRKDSKPAKIIAVKGMGIFGIGDSEKAASLAAELFIDAVKIAVYAESFGGYQFMPQDQIDFINNWEVERYRSKVSVK